MAEEEKVQAESAPVAPAASGGKSGMATWKKVVLVIVLAFVGLIVFAFVFTRDAQRAGDEFIVDLQAGDCAAIWERSSSVFREVTTEEAWLQACAVISPILQGEPDAIGVEKEVSSGGEDLAETAYEIDGTDGLTYIVQLQMTKEDGEWKLRALDSDVKDGTAQPQTQSPESDSEDSSGDDSSAQ